MPKLMWREPIETTVITSAREDEAPQAAANGEAKVRVRTLGDVAGRESGALIVLLVEIGALTLASPEFLTANNLATWRVRFPSSGSSRSVSSW